MKILVILVFLFLLSNYDFASNVINANSSVDSPAQTHADSSYESELIEKNEADKEMEVYVKEVSDAFLSVTYPEVYNLPTIYTQPTFHPNENDYFGKISDDVPIFSVCVSEDDDARKNCMSLTFDSAYINKFTYDILDILDQYNIKSTFFMTYEFMEKNPEQIMEIIKRGHEIGNHSTTHPDFNLEKDSKIIKEVMKAHNFIKYLVGVDMCLFRFPFGSYSPRTVSLLKKLGYYPIQWTLDSIDWKNTGKEFLINRFTDNEHIHEGSIILFHNGAKYTPEALPEIIDMIHSKGLKCVRVSDLLYKENFHVMSGNQIEGHYNFTNEQSKD